mmetsp:Transcript_4006/g.14160  ORF Transcript_4006/g.14160 Transcript_4006/m.14160 type:complete len:339 (-) Transcript_4006:703-1719(-)
MGARQPTWSKRQLAARATGGHVAAARHRRQRGLAHEPAQGEPRDRDPAQPRRHALLAPAGAAAGPGGGQPPAGADAGPGLPARARQPPGEPQVDPGGAASPPPHCLPAGGLAVGGGEAAPVAALCQAAARRGQAAGRHQPAHGPARRPAQARLEADGRRLPAPALVDARDGGEQCAADAGAAGAAGARRDAGGARRPQGGRGGHCAGRAAGQGLLRHRDGGRAGRRGGGGEAVHRAAGERAAGLPQRSAADGAAAPPQPPCSAPLFAEPLHHRHAHPLQRRPLLLPSAPPRGSALALPRAHRHRRRRRHGVPPLGAAARPPRRPQVAQRAADALLGRT